MTNFVVKKISFSTYVKFSALFGASIGVLMLIMALLMFPMIISSTPKEELLTTLPMFPAFLLAPIIAAFPFAMYGVISYPFYLLICKVIKKLTIEVELAPTELSIQPNNITDVPFAPSENDNNTNQGVE